MKKSVRIVLLGFFLILGHFWLYTKIFWESSFTDAPEVLANMYAKEYCTCLYVVGQNLEICRENHDLFLEPSAVDVIEKDKSVRVRVLWWTSRARWVSEIYGCERIDP